MMTPAAAEATTPSTARSALRAIRRAGPMLLSGGTVLALVVLAADCVPVLLADPVEGVIGAAHVGRPGLLAGTVAHLAFVGLELRGHHATANAAAGVAIMTGQRYGQTLQTSILVGALTALLALVGLVTGSVWLGALGGILAQVALLVYEHVFVRAGQEVPLS